MNKSVGGSDSSHTTSHDFPPLSFVGTGGEDCWMACGQQLGSSVKHVFLVFFGGPGKGKMTEIVRNIHEICSSLTVTSLRLHS